MHSKHTGCIKKNATSEFNSQEIDIVLKTKDFRRLGPVVQRWVSANPGLKFNLLF